MAIAYNATDAFNAGGSSVKATSATGTIPASAGIGDVIFLVFQASDTATTLPATTLTVTSTGNAWTQIGATQACAISSFANCKSSIWWLAVQAADQGATVTVHSTASLYLAAAAAGYSGVSTTTPVDASAFNVASAGQTTIPTSTVTASAASDWLLSLASVTSNTNIISVTKNASYTLRETYFAYNEVYAGIADLNTTSGTGTVGGASWTCGAFSGFVMWTVAVSAATGTAHPGTAALSGTGTLSGAGVFAGTATLSGAGTLGGTGSVALTRGQGIAALSGTGTLSGAGSGTFIQAAVLTGTGTLAATWIGVLLQPPATLDGEGTLNLSGVKLGFTAGLSGNGTLSVLQATGGLVFASPGAAVPYAYPMSSQVMVAPPGSSRWCPLGSLGHVTALTYSFTCPGGADAMSCTVMVPAAYRTQLFNPGWQVKITRGGHQVWSGKLDEPVPTPSGWTLTAVGDGNRGTDFAAVYSGTWPNGQPDDAVNEAIARGLPWVNSGIGTPAGAWFGQSVDSGAQTVTDLLNLICTRGGLTWYASSQPGGLPGTDISVFPLPTVPNRLLVATTPVARTLGGDVNTIWIRYQDTAADTSSGGSGAASFSLTSVANAASVTAHGVIEAPLMDLSNAGTMSAVAAQAVGNSVLAIYKRASYAGPFTARYGQLCTTGGQPIDPGTDQAGTVCRLILVDYAYGGEVQPNLPITFTVGSYAWDDLAQAATITPYQSVDLSLSGLLSMESTVLAPITASTGG